MTTITSPANPRIVQLRSLQTPRGRKKSGLFLVEGLNLLEALLDAHVWPREVYNQPELMQRTARGKKLLERLLHIPEGSQMVEVSERVIDALGDVQTSQGVVSVVAMERFQPEHVRMRRSIALRPALLILDDVTDPGNMGTILRTALATDVEQVLLTPGCVDYFSPKVLRAAVGAHIALPVAINLSWEQIAARIKEHSAEQVFLADTGSAHIYYEQDLTRPFALIIGNEAHGPSPAARALATRVISIPLANNVESLNAAMASGIILYEAMRQSMRK